MATPDGRTPKTRGSHFGNGDATARQETTNRPDVQAPVPTMQASAPRPAMGGRRVSSRTAAATRRAGAHHVQRESRSGGRNLAPFLVLGLVAIAAVLAIVLVVVPAITGGNGGGETQEVVPGTTVSVTVPEGSGAAAVADALYEAGVIADKSEFLSQVRRMNAEQSIKSGSYSFRTGDDTANIIQTLTTGPNAEISLTIPEGYTVASIAAAVEETLSIPADDFLAQAKASNYVDDYDFLEGAGNDSLEGFLFPKTYSFPTGEVTADQVIRTMLSQFQTELDTLDLSYPESDGLSIAEMVNLASIVEKESAPSTRGTVAAVFYNRLDNMGDPNYGFLQSDATTAYSVGHDPSAEEVHDENDPYSTYAHVGLPPTPICNPGLESLQAVCSPDMDAIENGIFYFYFWTNDAGETEYAFSRTYDEHMQAIANNS
ncbi:endolytic transglycosylase MltG [Olsenella sp. An285]|uniref:endolytic transglycosylase MltG n=1 Tax=Olsenella sp. An285 TaxID=1965621 RepID=UPI0019D04DCD|nr:endolytic transglycosylase MltG [Olsenella sp. An285]